MTEFKNSCNWENQIIDKIKYLCQYIWLLRIQMIFPKQQMKIENKVNCILKKQAIQLIIELYLSRKRDEDIEFLKKNFGTTSQLASSIGSSIKNGLTPEKYYNNKYLYGQNQKKAPIKCISLIECFKQEFLTLFTICPLIFTLLVFVSASVKGQYLMSWSSFIISTVLVIVNAAKASIHYFLSNSFKQFSLQKSKNNFYQIIRNGSLMEIQESELVVGDIVELGYKQKVPATGILFSPGQIFVKEGTSQDSTQLKLNLQNCLKRIQNMSDLDLKISFQQSNLPSPIILRGSQLIKGLTFSMLIISVTEEELLEKFDFNFGNKYSSKSIDLWIKSLYSNWISWITFIGSFALIFVTIQQMIEIKLTKSNPKLNQYIIFQFLLKLCTFIIILSPTSMLTLINSTILKLLTKLKIIENFQSYFTVKKILINQKSIVDHDEVRAIQLAVGQKTDIISVMEMQNISDDLLKLIQQALKIFKIKSERDSIETDLQRQKHRKYIHVYKREVKIISIFSQPNLAASSHNYPNSRLTLGKVNENSQIKSIGNANNKEESISNNFLINKNLLQPDKNYEKHLQKQNLKDIIASKCRIKSKFIFDSLIGIAQNKLNTYYYFLFNQASLLKMTYINVQGQVRLLNQDDRERILNLSKKMQKVYNITPIILGFSSGPYKKQSNITFLCLLGAKVETNNQIFQQLNFLQDNNIKTLAFINEDEETTIRSQQQVQEKYRAMNFWKRENNEKIFQFGRIKKMIGRFVCKQCMISNCKCKQKKEEASNIQPFLKISENVKVIYDVQNEEVKNLESLYKQIYQNVIMINSMTVPLSDYVSSILSCHQFVEKLKRSLIAFYSLSICYFFVALISWIRNIQTISPTQIIISFCLLSIFYFVNCLSEIKQKKSDEFNEQNGKVKLIKKQSIVRLIVTCFTIVLLSQIFQIFHYLLPEYGDEYNQVILKQNLDMQSCKYGPNFSMTTKFKMFQCQSEELGVQFSRLSTFITVYLYFSLCFYFISIHSNFKSLLSSACYLCSVVIYVLIIEKLPFLIQTYSFGLHIYHYIILIIAAGLTVLLSHFLSIVLCKISIESYFFSQLQNSISFKSENKFQIRNLKHYQRVKKWEGQANHGYQRQD